MPMEKSVFEATNWVDMKLGEFSTLKSNGELDEAQIAEANRRRKAKEKPLAAAGSVGSAVAVTSADLPRLANAPFSNSGAAVAEFSPQYWFEYFWQESKIKGGSDTRLVGIADEVFEKTGVATYRPRAEFAGEPADDTARDRWRALMTELLKLGFRRVTPETTLANPPASDHISLQKGFLSHFVNGRKEVARSGPSRKDGPPLPSALKDTVHLFWRGETRTFDAIVQQKGTKRQIDVASIASDLRMDQRWHPFFDPAVSKDMWFRQGQTDNDYYTAISVALNYETACCFPKINEKRVYNLPPEPVAAWRPEQLDPHRANLARVTVRDARGQMRTEVRVATRTSVYLLAFNGVAINTRKAGGGVKTNGEYASSFPEMGVGHIPLEGIYAVVPMVRVFDAQTETSGFTAIPDVSGAKLVHTRVRARELFGAAYEECDRQLAAVKSRGRFRTAWSPTGALAPTPSDVVEVVEFPVGAQTLANLRHQLQ